MVAHETTRAFVAERQKSGVVLLLSQGQFAYCPLPKGMKDVCVGDEVLVRLGEGELITERLERKSLLLNGPKRLAANLDSLVVFQSPEPFSPWLEVEKPLFLGFLSGLELHLVVNKADLMEDSDRAEFEAFLAEFSRSGVRTHLMSCESREGVFVPEGKLAVVGASGVGKSRWVSAVLGEGAARSLPLTKRGFGRHTTSAPKAYLLSKGWVIDLPGIRTMALETTDTERLKAYFNFPGEGGCKFRNCTHRTELECAVIASAESEAAQVRLSSYQALFSQMEGIRKMEKYGRA